MLIKSTSPAQQFVKEASSSHWYCVADDGTVEPRHDADLRTARKELLFPSPTTIEKQIRANPSLDRWIKNQVARSFVNNPRLPGEPEDTYAARVLAVADSSRDEAAIRGTAIHAAIERGGSDDPEIAQFYAAYLPWHTANVDTDIGSEVKMADPKIGVAGTVDRIVMHRQHGLTILDYKTQKVRAGKAAFYDSFPRQLSFYAGAYRRKHGVLPRIMSLVIDSQVPSAPYEKLYTLEEQEDAYKEFLAHTWLWCNSHAKGGYWPTGSKWSPEFPQ